MSKLKWLGIAVFLCMLAILAACGQDKDQAVAQQDEAEPTAAVFKLFGRGEIIRKSGNEWLITAYVQKNGSPHIDAVVFTINEATLLQDESGKALQPDEIGIGAQVEAWNTGWIMESYPSQTAAAKIVVLDDEEETSQDWVGRRAAVQAALSSQSESTAAIAVLAAKLDAEAEYWNVELVRHEAMEEPVSVRVDARSGTVEPIAAAENEAFRVFAPKPGAEVGPSFTVEGEARVFEAAFSWQLEDGHNILAEGHETAEMGAPEWGRFRFQVNYEKASQPNMTLILFVYSAKDGSVQNKLVIPLKAPENLVQYQAE